MPTPPMNDDTFDKVNFVIDAWTTGCDAPWYIYVETMKPAALKAFITLLTFGLDDVFRGFFRPKGLGPRRTGKGKGKFRKGLRRFPEIGELIGSHIPGAQEQKGKQWGNLGKLLWRIDGAMQAGLFLWLVADVAEDFAFNWTSLLFESYWCQEDPLGRFSWSKPGYQTHAGNVWNTVNIPDKDYQFSPPTWTGLRGQTGNVPCTVTCGLNVQPKAPFVFPTTFQTRIVKSFTALTYAESGPLKPDADGKGSLVLSGQVPPNTSFQVQVYSEPSFAEHGDGMVMAFESPD